MTTAWDWYQGQQPNQPWGGDWQNWGGNGGRGGGTPPDPGGSQGGTTPGGGTTTPTPGTTPPIANPGSLTPDQQSAKAILSGVLGQYGLDTLGDFVWKEYLAGTPMSQIMLDIRNTSEYQTRFPAMAALAKQGRALTETQYINYEQSAVQIFRAAGLPSGFYDQPDDFTKLLTGNVGLPELQTRVQDYQTAAFNTPPEVRQQLESLYGVSPGDLTAFFIDPDRALPIIQRQWTAAQAAGYSQSTGFGQLSRTEAESLSDYNLSSSQLQAGFGQLAGLGDVGKDLAGQNTGQLSNTIALGAEFQGNASDQQAIEARRQRLLNQFQGGGNVATTQAGAIGAGVAQ